MPALKRTLIACAPLLLPASAFVTQGGVPSSTSHAFVTPFAKTSRKHAPSSSSTARRDTEGDAIDIEARLSFESKLRLDKISIESLLAKAKPAVSLEEAQVAHGMPWDDTIGRSDHEDPLLYMPFWEWQMDFMSESLTNLRPIEHCTSDSCVDFGVNVNEDKKARIVNHCYASDEYRKIRMTYYDAGDNTQVFNSVWYPDPSYNLPVLGIDLLAFNRKKYLAIVDFQPLHNEEADHAQTYEHLLQPIKDKYDSLKGRMSSKFYDETQFFSKQMLFARFEDEGVVDNDLLPAFQQYVSTHVDLLKSTEADDALESQQAVLDRQKAYDTYSAERDPAAGLFAAMFGKEWAENFIFDFLFSLSERKDEFVIPPMPGGPPPGAAARKAGGGGGNPFANGKPSQQQQPAAAAKEVVGAR